MTITHRLAAFAALLLLIENAHGFQQTNKLLTSLNDLEQQSSASLSCYNELDAPRVRVGEFVTDSVGIYDGLGDLNKRCGTINTVASTLLLIPGVNIIGAKVLIPLTTGLTWLTRAISIIQTGTEPIINAMRRWDAPIKALGQNAVSTKPTLQDVMTAASKGKTHVSLVASEIAMVACGNTRSDLLGNMEAAASGMDVIPNAANEELKRADTACQGVKTFLLTTDSKIDSEVTTTLSIAKTSIDVINSGFDPIQEYLNEVDKVLDTKLCLSDVERIIEDELGIRREKVKEIGDKVVDVAEKIKEKAKNIFGGWGRRRRAVEALRQKRDVCVTVRQILDGSVAVDGGYKTAAEFLIKEVFNKVMPQLPGVTKELENLASTLLPFESDFDLQSRVNQMTLNPAPINNFLAIDYTQTFWEKPSPADVTGSKQTCSGEESLISV
ncbi:uncharacterized protein LOC135463162 [Liolophura sinensis]|uniref:uncharacterized protein LOC135463162 n=1 Tax=Liolophura sinensis TaxID=3198878 RepID=UPI0031590623